LKAGEPTRCPDTSLVLPVTVACGVMKKILLVAVLLGLTVFAVRKLRVG
jgi:hypothetical protein